MKGLEAVAIVMGIEQRQLLAAVTASSVSSISRGEYALRDSVASELSVPFSGEDWFDPLKEAVRFRVRGFIEGVADDALAAALGARERYQRAGEAKGYRNGHRDRHLIGAFGAVTVSFPRGRLIDVVGRATKAATGSSMSEQSRDTRLLDIPITRLKSGLRYVRSLARTSG